MAPDGYQGGLSTCLSAARIFSAGSRPPEMHQGTSPRRVWRLPCHRVSYRLAPVLRRLQEMLKTLIVDDEPIARRVLREELEAFPEVTVIGEAENGKHALQQIAKLEPDLVF